MEWDWVRVKTDILNDPKLRRYFGKEERCDWLSLICMAAKSRERGVILLQDGEIAYTLEVSDDDWTAFESKLSDHRMVHRREIDGALVLTNWERHQYERPSDTPAQVRERVAKHRAIKALSPPSVAADESQSTPKSTPATTQNPAQDPAPTPSVPSQSDNVTPLYRDVTPCNTIEQQSRAEQIRADKSSSSREESVRGEIDEGERAVCLPAADTPKGDLPGPDPPPVPSPPEPYVRRLLAENPHWAAALAAREAAYGDKITHIWPFRRRIVEAWADGSETPPKPPPEPRRKPPPERPPPLTPEQIEADRQSALKAKAETMASLRRLAGKMAMPTVAPVTADGS